MLASNLGQQLKTENPPLGNLQRLNLVYFESKQGLPRVI
jgi:hypothetical protein